MPEPTFTYILEGADPKVFEVPSSAASLWTQIGPYIAGPVKLKIEVVDPAAVWQYSTDHWCRAGGTTRNDAAALLPGAPIGALVGKLGGSTADCPPPPGPAGPSPMPAGNRTFAVGTFAVIEVKAEESGPLFLGMNDTLAGFAQHAGALKVKIATGS
jgi:hypothetical protein